MNRLLVALAVATTLVAMPSASLLPACSAHSLTFPLFPSSCQAHIACERALCACAGVGLRPEGFCSLAGGDVPCVGSRRCIAMAYLPCLIALQHNRTVNNDTSVGCAVLGTSIYMAELASIANGFSNSLLQRNCQAIDCHLTNNSCAGTGDPCDSIATVRNTPPPSIAGAVYVVRTKVFFRGFNFDVLLGNATNNRDLAESLLTDIGVYLGIPRSTVTIFDLSGSLTCDFGITVGSGVTLARLMASIESIQYGPTFLTQSRPVYARANGGNSSTFVVTSVIVIATLPPDVTRAVATGHPTATPSSVSAATRHGVAAWRCGAVAPLVILAVILLGYFPVLG